MMSLDCASATSTRTEERERESFAVAVCDRLRSPALMVRNEALKLIGGSALTDETIAVPGPIYLGATSRDHVRSATLTSWLRR